jgi:hypothetical protein
MATSPSTVSGGLPEGYTLEGAAPQSQPAVSGLPEGYTLEQRQADGTTAPTDTQAAYRQATAAGPFAPAGAAEKAMGAEIGDNKAQAKEALHNTINAAGETAAGVLGASVVPEALEAATPVLKHIASQYGEPAIQAIRDAAKSHPIVTKLLTHALETAGGLSMAKYMHLFGSGK